MKFIKWHGFADGCLSRLFILWIVLLLSYQLFGQTVELSKRASQHVPIITERMERGYFTLEKFGLITSNIVYSISGGLVDGWNWRRHQDNLTADEKDYYNKLWHRVKPIRDVSAFGIGGTIALDSKAWKMFDSWEDFTRTSVIAASDLILVSSINWILFDHFNYVGMGADVPFLHSSDWAKAGNNGLWGDVISSPFTKVGFLIFAVIQNYILTMLFG